MVWEIIWLTFCVQASFFPILGFVDHFVRFNLTVDQRVLGIYVYSYQQVFTVQDLMLIEIKTLHANPLMIRDMNID